MDQIGSSSSRVATPTTARIYQVEAGNRHGQDTEPRSCSAQGIRRRTASAAVARQQQVRIEPQPARASATSPMSPADRRRHNSEPEVRAPHPSEQAQISHPGDHHLVERRWVATAGEHSPTGGPYAAEKAGARGRRRMRRARRATRQRAGGVSARGNQICRPLSSHTSTTDTAGRRRGAPRATPGRRDRVRTERARNRGGADSAAEWSRGRQDELAAAPRPDLVPAADRWSDGRDERPAPTSAPGARPQLHSTDTRPSTAAATMTHGKHLHLLHGRPFARRRHVTGDPTKDGGPYARGRQRTEAG